MTRSPWFLVDGLPTDFVPADDRGLAFGDGVFETMAVIDGRVRFLDRHLGRLAHGCRRLAIAPVDDEQLRENVASLADGEDRAVIKLIVTRGSGGRGYDLPVDARTRQVLMKSPWPTMDPARYTAGIRIGVCRTRLGRCRGLAGLKTLNRLEQVLGRAEVTRYKLDEGLMLDDTDAVIEATAANLFIAGDYGVATPDLSSSGVAGVMRDAVLRTLGSLVVPCRVRRISLSDVMSAREIWLTNAISGVTPVASLGRVRFAAPDLAARVAGAMHSEGIAPCG